MAVIAFAHSIEYQREPAKPRYPYKELATYLRACCLACSSAYEESCGFVSARIWFILFLRSIKSRITPDIKPCFFSQNQNSSLPSRNSFAFPKQHPHLKVSGLMLCDAMIDGYRLLKSNMASSL